MKLSQLSGWNTSGVGFWHHVVQTGSSVRIESNRAIIVGPTHDPYVVLEDGTIEQFKPYPISRDDD